MDGHLNCQPSGQSLDLSGPTSDAQHPHKTQIDGGGNPLEDGHLLWNRIGIIGSSFRHEFNVGGLIG